jgi:PilZ domain
MSSPTHKRKSVRKRVTQVMMVTNAFTGEGMGRIGNLSNDGMMLITPKEMHDEHYFQVHFSLQAPGFKPEKVEIGVQCLWCDQARTNNTYWVGCKVIDISPDDQAALKRWVAQAEETVPER